jgi:hypothetical protein
MTKVSSKKTSPDSPFQLSVTTVEEQGILESFFKLPQMERRIIRKLLEKMRPAAGWRNPSSCSVWSQALHLLQICLVYINTLMIQRVLTEPDWTQRMLDSAIAPYRLEMNSLRLGMEDWRERIPLPFSFLPANAKVRLTEKLVGRTHPPSKFDQ